MNAVSPVETLVTDHLDLWTAALKRKSTAGRGSSSKVELYGIKKLRELILELAVRGLLVPQDPNDEPASELLRKIAAEKARLVKEGKIRKDKPLPVIDEKETPFTLPSNWTFARWGEIAEWAIGSGFPTEAQGENDQEILFSKVSDMNLLGNEKYIVTTVNSISRKTAEKIKAKAHPPGTVVFPKIGGAIATNKRRILVRETAIDNNCLGLIPGDGITTDYLYLLLSSVDLSAYQSGTSVPALSQGNLELIIAGLPPLSEQHRIVSKVDELMALCDQLEQETDASLGAHQTLVETLLSALTSAADHAQFASAWQRIAGHFDTLFTTEESIAQLKQTLLQLAVMGKLVPQDPNDEPASELLKKIAAEKAKLVKEGKIKKEKPLPLVGEDETLFSLPLGWAWCRLENVSLHSEAGWSPKCEEVPRVGSCWGVLKVSAVTWGVFNPAENKALPANLDAAPDCEVKPGDFLISRANTAELVARSVVVQNDAPPRLMMSDKIIRFSFSKEVCAAYLSLFNNSSGSRKYYLRVAGGTSSSMKNVSRLQIQSLAVALPPLAEQHRIVAKVDELMALCDQLKSRLSDAQTTQLHLADALVERAIG